MARNEAWITTMIDEIAIAIGQLERKQRANGLSPEEQRLISQLRRWKHQLMRFDETRLDIVSQLNTLILTPTRHRRRRETEQFIAEEIVWQHENESAA